ncbi:carbohydrate-binding module family 13 protein [Trametes sanguinea]|nr:carbohydrate-binding module family 13 protein [Trametes sanguinea]
MHSNARDRRPESTAALESGHTYKMSHARTRAVLDLSMKDWQSIRSAPWDASDNQKWVAELAESGGGWTFRNVATGLFLGIDGAPRPNAPVIATRQETTWDLQPGQEPSSLVLVVAGTRLIVQLAEIARSGASVKLGELRDGSGDWRLEKA